MTLSFLLLFAAVTFFMYFLFSSARIDLSGVVPRSAAEKRGASAGLDKEFREYEASYIFITPEKIKNQKITMMMLLGTAGFFLGVLGGVIPCLLLTAGFGAAGWFLPALNLNMKMSARKDAFQLQILDFLETVSNGLKAGLSFIQALESAAAQLPDPMKQELEFTLRQNQLGVNLDEALTAMSTRMKNDNFGLVVSAITVTRQLGGNLPEIFKIISETIRDRDTMEGKIKALTSQGKMQAILMGAMPFFLGAGIFMIDEKLILPLFQNPVGWALLLVMAVLNTLGFIFIRKIVNVEV
jgi:tight adherence protein B